MVPSSWRDMGSGTRHELRSGQGFAVDLSIILRYRLPGGWQLQSAEATRLETRVREGQYAKHKFYGHVDSLAPGSGNEFALLPPDNATGNTTKIVQRIPVKIVLDQDSVRGYENVLSPGMWCSSVIRSIFPRATLTAKPRRLSRAGSRGSIAVLNDWTHMHTSCVFREQKPKQ